MANDSDNGSKERVAFDLAVRVWTAESGNRNSEEIRTGTRKGLLDLYAECLDATYRSRKYDKAT